VFYVTPMIHQQAWTAAALPNHLNKGITGARDLRSLYRLRLEQLDVEVEVPPAVPICRAGRYALNQQFDTHFVAGQSFIRAASR